MAFELGNIFFKKLSTYFHINDTYKDENDEGLLERYLSIFGEELDTVVLPLIENFIKIKNPIESQDFLNEIVDPTNVDHGKFLDHIAYAFGNPPDPTEEDDLYRKILSFVISLNKIRGTHKAISVWGNLLGLTLRIIEIDPVQIKYDSGYQYDSELTTEISAEQIVYDTECPTCSDFYLVVEGAIKADE